MVLEGNKIWLYVAWLIRQGISEGYIKKKICEARKSGKVSWRNRKDLADKRIVLIDYDSLPDTTKLKLPSRADLLKLLGAENTEKQLDQLQQATATLNQLHAQNCQITDYQFFLKHTNDKIKAEDLKNAAGWLRFLNSYKTPVQTRTINFNTKSDLRKAALAQILENATARDLSGKAFGIVHLYGFKITNVTVLQRKELEWASASDNTAALSTLIHANIGNNNRRIIGKLNADETQRILLPSGKIDFSEWNARTLVYLFTNPGHANKYDFENLYRRYQYVCKKADRKPEVELSAVKEFLTCNEVKKYVTRERSGWAELDKLLPHVSRKRPEYSLSKGGMDGLSVDFMTRIDASIDEKGNKVPARQLMLTVVAIFDYMSEAITGFDIGLVEDGLMVRNAFRNHLNIMGGRSFIEIESDRGSANLAKESQRIFSETCQIMTQPVPNDPQGKAPNPKARFVERLLQEFNRLAQNLPSWKGTNITSIDQNRKPNPDYRGTQYTDGFAQSAQQIIELVNIYNNDTYNRAKGRMQICMENINPEAPTIPRENIARLLNQTTLTTVRNAKISFEVNRRTYEYAFPEADQHAHQMMKGFKVKVYYDETDMDTIDVFGENDNYIGTLGKLKRIQGAKAEQTAEDLRGLGVMVGNRSKAIERIETVNRKVLESWAAELGVDISNMSLQNAQEFIAGMKSVSHEELFAEALETPTAKQHTAYYQDRLIRANGEAVPVSKKEQQGIEEERRRHEREKFNRNNKPK